MKSVFFCAYHAERLKACESQAYSHWAEMMRRGVRAYVECRFDEADLCLGAALDIGLLRHTCEENGLFSALHIMKPAEFLLEVQLLEQRFSDAEATLQKISTIADRHGDWLMSHLADYLAQAYERVEQEGKSLVLQPVRETAVSVH